MLLGLNIFGAAQAHPIICPVEAFAHLCANHSDWFATALGVDARHDFWVNMLNTKQCSHLRNRDLSMSIAVGCHGDGAPFSKTDRVFTLAWNGIHGTGNTLGTRIVYTVVQKSQMVPQTLDALFTYFAWAWNTLASGKWPQTDWQGVAYDPLKRGKFIADGFCAHMLQVRGDWEFFADYLRVPRWNSDNPCWLCPASMSGDSMLWTDRDGAWNTRLRTHEQWVAKLEAEGLSLPAVFQIQGFGLHSIMADVMHTLDLGVSSHACGNICWEMMQLMGVRQAEQIKILEGRLKLVLQPWHVEFKNPRTPLHRKDPNNRRMAKA